jgi:ribosomal protein S12 methylthiotransferase
MVQVNITTLGCPKNQVDSEQLIGKFSSEGFLYADSPEDADIILINTCGFIRDAKEESIEEILRLSKIKNGKKMIVFGCLAQRYRNELTKELPEIDAIFGVGEDSAIIEYCKGLVKDKKKKATGDIKISVTNNISHTAQSFAYLKIADGCDKRCTFCVIPSIRGKFRSIHPDQILSVAENYLKKGIRELILVAQDITSYGKDLKGYNLTYLLKDLISIKEDFRLRLLYLYPTEITKELLELIATEKKIHKYLDIPLQHSEDRILRLMGRRGTRKEYIKLIRNIRRTIPGIALRTTFIVGFPGETEEDFQGLIDFIEEIRFDRLGVFKYSKEEGTVASRLKGQISEKTKNRRFDEIMQRQAAISLEKNKELIGKTYEAIVDEIIGKTVIARIYSHAPEVDGVLFIDNIEGKIKEIGRIVTVKIADAYDYDLKGVLI